MPGHRLSHEGGNRSEILTDQHRSGTVRLQGQHREPFLGPVPDVDAVGRGPAGRHPEQPVHAHHVIDPRVPRVPQEVPDARDRVAVPVLPDHVGMQRAEPPVLTTGEQWVRGRSGRDPCDEDATFPPGVEACGVHPEREVEVQAGTPTGGQVLKLAVDRVLHEQVVPAHGIVPP